MFEWSQYLELAVALRDESRDGSLAAVKEAATRAAVSRAYYAAFGQARAFARRRLGFQPAGDERDHAGLRQLFARTNRRNLAIDLNDLRQWRNQCDYDDQLDGLDAMLAAAIERARRVIERCR